MLAHRTRPTEIKMPLSHGEPILKTSTGENLGKKDGCYYGPKLLMVGLCVKQKGREGKIRDETIADGKDVPAGTPARWHDKNESKSRGQLSTNTPICPDQAPTWTRYEIRSPE